MLLRNSLSNTKKFFQKTLKSVKSLFCESTNYQRLPNNTPPFKPFSCICRRSQSYRELDKFDLSNRWNGEIDILPSTGIEREAEVCYEDYKVEDIRVEKELEIWEIRRSLVMEKLKELEMMDLSNVEHVLEIEELLHCYSHLTCPVYVHIFHKFFMDMYSDLFNLQAN